MFSSNSLKTNSIQLSACSISSESAVFFHVHAFFDFIAS